MAPSLLIIQRIILFITWYVISTGYSLLAKQAMNMNPNMSPELLSLLQFGCGILTAWIGEGFKIERIRQAVRAGGPLMALIGLANFFGAYLTAASMSQGSVAVTFIIKATEPLFAVGLSVIFLGSTYGWRTMLALLPLTLGLIMACWKSSAGSDNVPRSIAEGGTIARSLLASSEQVPGEQLPGEQGAWQSQLGQVFQLGAGITAMVTASAGAMAGAGAAASVGSGGLSAISAFLSPGNTSAIIANVGMAGRNVLTKARLQLQQAESRGSAGSIPGEEVSQTSSSIIGSGGLDGAPDERKGRGEAVELREPGEEQGFGQGRRAQVAGGASASAAAAPTVIDGAGDRDIHAGEAGVGGEGGKTGSTQEEYDDSAVPKGRLVATAGGDSAPGPHVVFGVMSLWSFAYTVGLILVTPGGTQQVLDYPASVTSDPAAMLMGLAGLSHALYTTCSFAVLTFLQPATHAISNAMKHVVVIGSSTIFLGQSLTAMQCIGAVLAVGGVLAYNYAVRLERAAGVTSPTNGLRPSLLWFFRSWPAVATSFLVVLAGLVVMRNRSVEYERSLHLPPY